MFPNLEEILVNAWSLQNSGDLFLAGLQNANVPLNAENCKQNVKKIKVILRHFCFIKMDKNCLHKFNSSVLYYIKFIFIQQG